MSKICLYVSKMCFAAAPLRSSTLLHSLLTLGRLGTDKHVSLQTAGLALLSKPVLLPFSVLIPKRDSLQKIPTSIIPIFMSAIEGKTRVVSTDPSQQTGWTVDRLRNTPLKNRASPTGYPLGGGTLFSIWPRIALVILSRALVPYCETKGTLYLLKINPLREKGENHSNKI